MDLRVDLHIFTEICEAIRRGEEVVLIGRDAKSTSTRLVFPPELVTQIRPCLAESVAVDAKHAG